MTAVPTPAACHRPPTALILGAGIAGLTAAHELAERGFAVTVLEAREDERERVGDLPPQEYPPVKLGGLAASQYSTTGPDNPGSHAQLRPFPGRRGRPRTPGCAVAGEHGFRFFPAYYLHIWDTLQRIPLYQQRPGPDGSTWQPTSRTVLDNLRRVTTQAMTVPGLPSLVFPRDRPRTIGEVLTTADQVGELGITPDDSATFTGRILRYLVTSPLRRASELQNLSMYDYFIGRDAQVPRRFLYSPKVEPLLLDMPKVLAAFDSRWGDARTNITTYLQLILRVDERDTKADGVLNGPTTEAWFDHWYHMLVQLGVRFARATVDRIEPPPRERGTPPPRRPRVEVVLADGTRHRADYVVCALDAPAAERITAALRRAGTGGTVAELDGFTTSLPPPSWPLQPGPTRPTARRDPSAMDTLGRRPWDRFQTLAGIQFYFDTEFQLVRGHAFYSGTEWGLSSINQQGMWERRPGLAREGYISRLSVDIGDFNTPSRVLLDEHGRGKAARDCTADEIAAEVWRQIAAAVTSSANNVADALLPWPVWYSLDRNLVLAPDTGRAVRNEAPYLVPIVGDWPNRPGPDPWNPHGTSWTTRPSDQDWVENLESRDVWQARHGGYEVHHNSLVFAGTWTKTFTRMTTMESACESARHAVNAVLDHYLWASTGGADRRERTLLEWRVPFDFLDQGLSSPIRMPTPAGDYCFIYDVENREPFDARALRNLDSDNCRRSLPHPLDLADVGLPSIPFPSTAQPTGGPPMTGPPTAATDYTGQLLTYLQLWRQHLEQAAAAAATLGTPPAAPPTAPPPIPGFPTPTWGVPPGTPTPAGVTTTSSTPAPAPLNVLTAAPPGPDTWAALPAPPGPPVPPVAVPAPAGPAGGSATAADVGWPQRPAPPDGTPRTDKTRGDGGPAQPGAPHPRSAFAWVADGSPPDPVAAAEPVSLYAQPTAAAADASTAVVANIGPTHPAGHDAVVPVEMIAQNEGQPERVPPENGGNMSRLVRGEPYVSLMFPRYPLGGTGPSFQPVPTGLAARRVVPPFLIGLLYPPSHLPPGGNVGRIRLDPVLNVGLGGQAPPPTGGGVWSGIPRPNIEIIGGDPPA
jgi:hypothetical protein